ncbi:MAG: HlyD family efflux transporter periplasmic adaptor subunit [Variovorax sp.]
MDQGFISRTALDTSQSSLNSARSTHRAALAAVEMARKSLDDTVLRSPLAGQVSQRFVQPGERVAVDARVVEVIDLSRIEVEATSPRPIRWRFASASAPRCRSKAEAWQTRPQARAASVPASRA